MKRASPSGTVYSTAQGRVCPVCGWPERECRCSRSFDEPVPVRITARLRVEKAGRGGKTVTVIDGLPRNGAFLKDVARELRGACGTGGTVRDGCVELQGDHRERLRALLAQRGWTVKG